MTLIQLASATLLALVLTLVTLRTIAPFVFHSLFKRYLKSSARINGAKAARQMLKHNGITDVRVSVWPFTGEERHCYDAKLRCVFLTYDVYHSHSVAAIAIACHEAAHAIQHEEKFEGILPHAIFVEYDANKRALEWLASDLARSVGGLNKWVSESRKLLRWSMLTYIY